MKTPFLLAIASGFLLAACQSKAPDPAVTGGAAKSAAKPEVRKPEKAPEDPKNATEQTPTNDQATPLLPKVLVERGDLPKPEAVRKFDVPAEQIESPEARALLQQAVGDRELLTPEPLKALFLSDQVMTAHEFEALLLARGQCRLNAQTLTFDSCPIGLYEGILSVYGTRVLDTQTKWDVAKRLADHPDMRVRSAAIETLFYESSSSVERKFNLEGLIEVIQLVESDPSLLVLQSALRQPFLAPRNQLYRKFALRHVDDNSPLIRRAVMDLHLAAEIQAWELDDFRQAYLRHLEDPDKQTQKLTIERIGECGDYRSVAALALMLHQEKYERIHPLIITSMMKLWLTFNPGVGPGYMETLKYFKTLPYSEHRPAPDTVSALPSREVIEQAKPAYVHLQDWVLAMEQVISEEGASLSVKKEALRKLKEYGGLEGLKVVSLNIQKMNQPELSNLHAKLMEEAESH